MASLTKVVLRFRVIRTLNFPDKNVANFKIKQEVLFHCSSSLNVKGQKITMPSLSPTMSEGKIVKWLKKEGDPIQPGDILCDIETDKAVVSLETEEEGILAKIIVPENSKSISIGGLIALMVGEGEDWQKVELPSEEESKSPKISTDVNVEKSVQSEASAASSIQVKMPSLSPTMTSGTIIKWHKSEGDAIAAGDVLCDIQTDKAVISMDTDEDGILAKIIVSEGVKDVKVGTLIALMVSEGEDWKNVTVPQSTQSTNGENSPADSPSSSDADDVSKSGKIYGPAVRSLLTVYQLDPGAIKASGRRNILLKEDVLRFIEDKKLQKKPPIPVSLPSAAPQATATKPSPREIVAPPGPPKDQPSTISNQYSKNFGRSMKEKYVDIELNNFRRVIAKRLHESKRSIPHAYESIRCSVDELLKIKQELIYQGITASLNDYIIKATAFALESCPRVNVIYVNDELQQSKTVDIAIAVATENGLITPIITNALGKVITEISTDVKNLAIKARSGKLKLHEFQGGSFTISNLGMFGIKEFSAIINPPQVGILAVGTVIDIFGSDQRTHKNIIMTLSFDRRAMQGDEAANFLETIKFFLENPKKLVAENISVARSLSL